MHTNARQWRVRLLEHSVPMPATCLPAWWCQEAGPPGQSWPVQGWVPKASLRSVAYEGYEVAYEEQRPWAKLLPSVSAQPPRTMDSALEKAVGSIKIAVILLLEWLSPSLYQRAGMIFLSNMSRESLRCPSVANMCSAQTRVLPSGRKHKLSELHCKRRWVSGYPGKKHFYLNLKSGFS